MTIWGQFDNSSMTALRELGDSLTWNCTWAMCVQLFENGLATAWKQCTLGFDFTTCHHSRNWQRWKHWTLGSVVPLTIFLRPFAPPQYEQRVVKILHSFIRPFDLPNQTQVCHLVLHSTPSYLFNSILILQREGSQKRGGNHKSSVFLESFPSSNFPKKSSELEVDAINYRFTKSRVIFPQGRLQGLRKY